MERWGKAEDDLSSRMSDNDIKRKFQLLKFDQGGGVGFQRLVNIVV